jgi:hypothetical protein
VRIRTLLIAVPAFAALCAWCGWISGFHRTSGAAEVTWVVSLVAVVVVDGALWRGSHGNRVAWRLPPAADPWPRGGRGGSRRSLQGVAPWLILILVALAWDVLGIDTGPHQYHLTVSALAQAYRPLNAAVLLIWMLVGIGYEAARVRAPEHGRPASRRLAAATEAERHEAPGTQEVLGMCVLGVGPHTTTPALLLPSSPPIGVAFWIAVPVAAIVIDLVARRTDGVVATGEEFVRFISTSKVAHILLIAAWAFAGYHLFAR